MSKGFSWLFVIAGAVLILLEVLLGAASGFDFLLIGSAILLGGLLGLLTGSPAAGVATAGVLSLLYIFVGRRKIRSRLAGHTGTASNVDALMGRTVIVVERIEAQHAGRVKLEGEQWRAQLDNAPLDAQPLEPGQNARVTRIDGVTAYVVPLGE
jgi:membrane protein implicated in regulation of membrane protease activity